MDNETPSLKLGKKDAELFISKERIDYEPFVAMSDLHMVRKTFAVDYDALDTAITKLDPDLWKQINDSATELAQKHGKSFDYNQYALGFTEGVAAVWDTIKDKL